MPFIWHQRHIYWVSKTKIWVYSMLLLQSGLLMAEQRIISMHASLHHRRKEIERNSPESLDDRALHARLSVPGGVIIRLMSYIVVCAVHGAFNAALVECFLMITHGYFCCMSFKDVKTQTTHLEQLGRILKCIKLWVCDLFFCLTHSNLKKKKVILEDSDWWPVTKTINSTCSMYCILV